MTSVAEILGKRKAGEIKLAATNGQLTTFLTHLVKESDFYLNDETTWAFAKVATYLEDGWQSQRQYTRLKEGCVFTMDELGRAIASLVGGTRYDKRRAAEVGCPWTSEGEWPTRADLAAFLFFVCVTPPN